MDVSYLTYCFSQEFVYNHWRDGIEILFFSSLFYAFSCWLRNDPNNNLVGYFYGYCACAITAQLLDLSTITACMMISFPIVLLLFMFMHHDILQRNFIALKNVTVPHHPSRDWLTLVLRSALKIMNEQTPALIVIEHTDSIAPFINTPYLLDAPITHGFMEMICTMKLINAHSFLWLTSTGMVRAVDAQWKTQWNHKNQHPSAAWIDSALAHTHNTDALVLFIDPSHHTCSIVLKGALHEGLSLESSATLIRTHIKYPIQTPAFIQGYAHDTIIQKNHITQRTP